MKKIIIASIAFAPLMTFAQAASTNGSVGGLITKLGEFIAQLTPIAFAAAVLFFFYGLAKFILKSGEDQDSGRQMMIWGVIAIFVMASVFGLVKFLQTTFNIADTDSITVPSVIK